LAQWADQKLFSLAVGFYLWSQKEGKHLYF
jgi:hypothetical protein